MKKSILYSLIVMAFTLPACSYAQHTMRNTLNTENSTAKKENDKVILSTTIKTDDLHLGAQEMIYLTPVLYSADSTRFHEFDPIIIAGHTRYKVLQREIGLGNTHFEHNPQAIIRYKKHAIQAIPVTLTVDYRDWMSHSRLAFHESQSGCACESEGQTVYNVMIPTLPAPFTPKFEMAYIAPPQEEIKQRSETYAAHINFEVAKHVILPNYKNNAEVLGKVDEIIDQIRNDKNLKVNEFLITGYASPEGNAQSNLLLSQNRAEAFVLYLINKYKIVPSEIRTDWKGEDWAGLREIVVHSNIPDRQHVLDILDHESNVATRKSKLQQLSGGSTYKMMLRDDYPSLRRNEYTISFTVKEFDLNEAREIIKTRPQYLSQHEMYLVANSYPKNSTAYNEVFQTIEKYFPNDEVAILNTAAASLEQGVSEEIITKLENINNPEAWNNLGIAYFEKKDYKKAEEYFRKASQANLPAGISNLQQFNKFTDSI